MSLFPQGYKYGISYSKEYYCVVISKTFFITVDIEKEINSKIFFKAAVRYIQDRKIWSIKECAAKACYHGIKSILKEVHVRYLFNIGAYELWKVTLAPQWSVTSIIVVYRFVYRRLHVSFFIRSERFYHLHMEYEL
jgi:phosphopantetheinyl transferase